MIELKTLKDIEDYVSICEDVDQYTNKYIVEIDKLKAEAVKWVNADLKEDRNWREMFEDFFNLTKEDLEDSDNNNKTQNDTEAKL